jgi:hypothetical protein
MTDEAKQQAWRRLCSQLEALGIDPYTPQVPADHPHHSQVQAILADYKVAIGEVVPVPPGWEGSPPLQAITGLADLAGWLNDQWISTLATEMGGEAYKTDALEQAARAVRNGYRVLAWLGMDDRPERPFPAETLAVAKQQFDALECWVKQMVKDGWTPPEPSQPEEASPDTTGKRRKRNDFPNKYQINLLIDHFLSQHPDAPIRDVVMAVELSQGTVQQSEAWQREMARRKAAKEPNKRNARPLTRKMLQSIGRNDDPAARLEIEDAIWRRIIEEADSQKRSELHGLNPDQKRQLIEAAREHYADRLADEDD